tara:strand:- start:10 stop:336 length:327 start_codon:yes stop_codon:yes gene_type:complete
MEHGRLPPNPNAGGMVPRIEKTGGITLKKIIATAAIATFALSLAACNGANEEAGEQADDVTEAQGEVLDAQSGVTEAQADLAEEKGDEATAEQLEEKADQQEETADEM